MEIVALGGELRVRRGANIPFQTSKASCWTQNTRFEKGEEEGPHKSNFPKKKGEIQP